jgi:hypothetical protein
MKSGKKAQVKGWKYYLAKKINNQFSCVTMPKSYKKKQGKARII